MEQKDKIPHDSDTCDKCHKLYEKYDEKMIRLIASHFSLDDCNNRSCFYQPVIYVNEEHTQFYADNGFLSDIPEMMYLILCTMVSYKNYINNVDTKSNMIRFSIAPGKKDLVLLKGLDRGLTLSMTIDELITFFNKRNKRASK